MPGKLTARREVTFAGAFLLLAFYLKLGHALRVVPVQCRH